MSQTDAGLFVTDDWRARPNLTLSFGVRYEAQSNLGGLANWAPRVGIAWGLDARANRPAKTVLRAGFGTFFDRIPLTVTLNSLRYDGTNQQSYLILNPTFFPSVPPAAALEANQQPQQLRPDPVRCEIADRSTSAPVRCRCQTANWIAPGPPADSPITATRSTPSVSSRAAARSACCSDAPPFSIGVPRWPGPIWRQHLVARSYRSRGRTSRCGRRCRRGSTAPPDRPPGPRTRPDRAGLSQSRCRPTPRESHERARHPRTTTSTRR